MEEHPGVVFRDGPAGRRASLLRGSEPDLGEDELVELIEGNTGVAVRLIRTALDYWAAYRDEVEALIEHAEQVEQDALRAADRTDALLRR